MTKAIHEVDCHSEDWRSKLSKTAQGDNRNLATELVSV